MMSFFGGFSAQKLKPHLKMAVSRFQIAANKKSAIMKQQMREIAVMLAEDPPREEKAKIRAEALIREDNCVEAYEILQLECELLAERIKLIQVSKECPPDLVSCISTVMWAADRVDISELSVIRQQFRSKYGKKFEEEAVNNVGGVLNERVVSKLSVQPPAAYLVQTYLERICDQFEVDWKPKVPVKAEGMAEPMAAPVGYSVQVASGTGLGDISTLGEVVSTGQVHTDKEAGFDKTAVSPAIPPPVVSATPYVPTQPNQDFEEVDIFVPPPAPTAPVVNGGTRASAKSKDNDDDEEGSSPAGGGDATGSSYADLAARFDQLKK